MTHFKVIAVERVVGIVREAFGLWQCETATLLRDWLYLAAQLHPIGNGILGPIRIGQ